MPWHICSDLRTDCSCQFAPPTIWSQGLDSNHQLGSKQVPFPAEWSCCPLVDIWTMLQSFRIIRHVQRVPMSHVQPSIGMNKAQHNVVYILKNLWDGLHSVIFKNNLIVSFLGINFAYRTLCPNIKRLNTHERHLETLEALPDCDHLLFLQTAWKKILNCFAIWKIHMEANCQPTSAHSVEPRRPNSSASQLANRIVLLGLHPKIQVDNI